MIFGNTGGVMEAALRTVYRVRRERGTGRFLSASSGKRIK